MKRITVCLTLLVGSIVPLCAQTTEVEVTEDAVIFEEVLEEEVTPNADIVYTIVEQSPEYPGGMEKWIEYLKLKLKYPKDALASKTEGTVFVSFVVQPTGKLTDFSVIKGLIPSCDQEALRVMQESIDWKPGRQRNVAVKTRFVLPIKFKLP